ncbi:MAG: hypothetical protein JNN11_02140 [Candidatus Doudnabacteria bacterium]|nr:hypothetical protein [Candidatus Doudnabacteria bacterium]
MKRVMIVLWLVLVLAASAAFGQEDPLAQMGKMRLETARNEVRVIKEWSGKLQTFQSKLKVSGQDLEKGLVFGDHEVLQSINRMIGSQRTVIQVVRRMLEDSRTSLQIEVTSGCKEGAAFPFETEDCERFKSVIRETDLTLKSPEPKVLVDAWEKAKKAYPTIFKE